MFLSCFKWYRRWRGGRWAKVTGLMWGKNWIRVGPEAFIPSHTDQESYSYGKKI